MTRNCISCGSVYSLYREDVGEFWCNDCWRDRGASDDTWPF
jgi:hypothetical protein